MKVSLHSNGQVIIEMTAETKIESAFLLTMVQAAEKGTTIKFAGCIREAGADAAVGGILSMEV